jgi:hypothetical protein
LEKFRLFGCIPAFAGGAFDINFLDQDRMKLIEIAIECCCFYKFNNDLIGNTHASWAVKMKFIAAATLGWILANMDPIAICHGRERPNSN